MGASCFPQEMKVLEKRQVPLAFEFGFLRGSGVLVRAEGCFVA